MNRSFSTAIDNKVSLDIIIPTYNRARFLKKNLVRLLDYIENVDNLKINILVSNNCSSDNTSDVLSELACEKLTIFNQIENIGGVNNLLFLLEKSQSDYIMTLGDDDYIPMEYLSNVAYAIESFSPGVIFGNCEHVDEFGNKLGFVRDTELGKKIEVFESNIYNRLRFNNYASQISGLVFLRSGLYDRFCQSCAFNLYPQISFFLLSTESKSMVYLRSSLISITQLLQSKKDWSYGDDCLLDDKFNNYKCYFNTSYLSRVLFETNVLTEPNILFLKQLCSSPCKFYRAIFWGGNWTMLSKFLFPIFISIGIARGIINRVRKKSKGLF